MGELLKRFRFEKKRFLIVFVLPLGDSIVEDAKTAARKRIEAAWYVRWLERYHRRLSALLPAREPSP